MGPEPGDGREATMKTTEERGGTMKTLKAEVGSFRIFADEETDSIDIEGPAAYIKTVDFAQRCAAIERGDDMLFNIGVARGSDSFTAILVSIQTHYAAWSGKRQLLAALVR
jgi:hypothetical protein